MTLFKGTNTNMHYSQTVLRVAVPLACLLLAACQTLPAGTASVAKPAPQRRRPAQPPPCAGQHGAASTDCDGVAGSEPVSLGRYTEGKKILVDSRSAICQDYPKVGLVAESTTKNFQLVDTATSRSIYTANLGEPIRTRDGGGSRRPTSPV